MHEQDNDVMVPAEMLESLAAALDTSQSVAIVAPKPLQGKLAIRFASRALCHAGDGADGCPSCLAWNGENHPDLITTGAPEQAPGIEDCRRIWEDVSLVPVVGACRLAVLFGCDRLSLPAANSLLKITEEPPERGRVLLVLEEDNLIPTLRSRLHVLTCHGGQENKAVTMPQGTKELLKWIESTKNRKPAELLVELADWVPTLAGKGHPLEASRMELARIMTEKANLSTAMIQDLVHEVLQEGSQFDDIFDDLW